jgi:DNA-binding transcriptional MerR regulator
MKQKLFKFSDKDIERISTIRQERGLGSDVEVIRHLLAANFSDISPVKNETLDLKKVYTVEEMIQRFEDFKLEVANWSGEYEGKLFTLNFEKVNGQYILAAWKHEDPTDGRVNNEVYTPKMDEKHEGGMLSEDNGPY